MTDRNSLAKRLIKDLVLPIIDIDAKGCGGGVIGMNAPSDGYVIMSFREGRHAQVQRATFSDVCKSEGISTLKTPKSKNEELNIVDESSFYGEAFWIGSDDEDQEEPIPSTTFESDKSSQKDDEDTDTPKVKMSRLTALSKGLLNNQGEDLSSKKINVRTKSYLGDSRAVYYGGNDDGRKMLRCRECGKHYRNDYSLRHHICLRRKEVWKKGDVPKQLVDGQLIYFCPACSKPFRWMGNLTRHFYVHTGQRFFKCDICDKEFFSAYQVRRHMNSHTGMRYKCRVCDKPFTCVYACTWHMRQHCADQGSVAAASVAGGTPGDLGPAIPPSALKTDAEHSQ